MRVRHPAVAGSFYPADPATLRQMVDQMLADAASEDSSVREKAERAPKALIVPHAGYIYSGPIAASAFAVLSKFSSVFRRVVLIGPAHRVAIRGLALPDVDAFDTPLGRVPLDVETLPRLDVPRNEGAHSDEHSLEVELPFLTQVLESFHLVPLVVGDAAISEVVSVLESVWGGPETLIVVSSDLSHYLPYEVAKRLDESTARAIAELDPDAIKPHQACGSIGVRALLTLARQKRLRPKQLDLRSSGDTAGSHNDRVVGYGSFAFYD